MAKVKVIESTEDLRCYALCLFGLHAKTIAKQLNWSVGQVYSFCRQHELSLRDYRNGQTAVSRHIIGRCSVKGYEPNRVKTTTSWADIISKEN
jgi:hypothetical protein